MPGPREGEGGTGARCGGPTVGLRGAPRRPREGAAPAPPNATPPRRRGAAAVTAGGGRAGRGRGARPKFLPPWEQRELCLGICHRRGPQTFRGTSAPRRRPRRCGRAPPAPRLRPRRGGGGGATPALPMQGPRRRRRRPGGKSAAGAAQNMESRAGCVRGGTVRCSARLGGRCGAVRGGGAARPQLPAPPPTPPGQSPPAASSRGRGNAARGGGRRCRGDADSGPARPWGRGVAARRRPRPRTRRRERWRLRAAPPAARRPRRGSAPRARPTAPRHRHVLRFAALTCRHGLAQRPSSIPYSGGGTRPGAARGPAGPAEMSLTAALIRRRPEDTGTARGRCRP